VLQWAFVRNWFTRLCYPVHSFLKPAAFHCGPLPKSPVPEEPHAPADKAAQPQPAATVEE
jgi:hypothetical protein